MVVNGGDQGRSADRALVEARQGYGGLPGRRGEHDGPRAGGLREAVAALKARFGDEVVAVALPIGEEAGFKGVVDLLTMKAYVYSGGAGKGTEQAIPDDLVDGGCRKRARPSSTAWPKPTTPCSRSTWRGRNSRRKR